NNFQTNSNDSNFNFQTRRACLRFDALEFEICLELVGWSLEFIWIGACFLELGAFARRGTSDVRQKNVANASFIRPLTRGLVVI
ncbi:MAG: hypothetical protein Q8R39_04940, partial [bacterium]|nr:hypothetical protein [bacterium]